MLSIFGSTTIKHLGVSFKIASLTKINLITYVTMIVESGINIEVALRLMVGVVINLACH